MGSGKRSSLSLYPFEHLTIHFGKALFTTNPRSYKERYFEVVSTYSTAETPGVGLTKRLSQLMGVFVALFSSSDSIPKGA